MCIAQLEMSAQWLGIWGEARGVRWCGQDVGLGERIGYRECRLRREVILE